VEVLRKEVAAIAAEAARDEARFVKDSGALLRELR
jgi:hypothetical protein